jgi:chemotaxis methyl-accepting protein methylase
VLIYFSDADKQTVLRRLTTAVEPAGYLGLGTSERSDMPQVAPGWFRKPAAS